MINFFADRLRERQIEPARLYRAVAWYVRARFSAEDADVVASWFDRLAAGEDPRKIFPRVRGRKPQRPDDIDITWIVHQCIEAGMKPEAAYKGVAGAHGRRWKTVRNIYSKCKAELGR